MNPFSTPTDSFLADYATDCPLPVPESHVSILVNGSRVFEFETPAGIHLDRLARAMVAEAGYEVVSGAWSSLPFGQKVVLKTTSDRIKFLARFPVAKSLA